MTLEENKDRLLLIFTRNPKLGKCKTRLAATIGDQAALDIYMILIRHTAEITKDLSCSKEVYYSEEVPEKKLEVHGVQTIPICFPPCPTSGTRSTNFLRDDATTNPAGDL